MQLIDLSPMVDPNTPVWPGDVPFSRSPKWTLAQGDAVAVSTVTSTTHVGAHIDAPSHVRPGAPDISRIELAACVGPCLVLDVRELVDVKGSPHGFAKVADILEGIDRLHPGVSTGTKLPRVERILLRHRSQPFTDWDAKTPGLDPAFVRWFAEQGGRLIGVDLASFDPERSTSLDAHHAAIDGGVVMLEGLELSRASEGVAELIALPIAWRGADAAPVRAVLRV